jgi:D-beta-D-heptose 7-phosphate kinase/D-beta-D-heptose 1-phosphate adenosyltransferase
MKKMYKNVFLDATSVNSLRNANVLCIGDIMMDRFIYGDVDRISPEAPIPIFNIQSEKLMLGGAGNVANNLSGLGASTQFISVVGDDPAGQEISNLIGDIPNIKTTLITDKERRTSIKTRFIASGQQMMRTDDETISYIKGLTRKKVAAQAKLALKNCTAMVLADYAKGVLIPEIIQELIKLANKVQVPVIIDPQGRNYNLYNGADLITPNCKELSDATNMPTSNDNEIIAAARKLISENTIKSVLTTRSGDGMSLIDHISFKTFKAEALEVYDVSGAGDTVAAAIAASLAAGSSLEQAVQLANTAAGIVVGKLGTAVAYSSEIIEALHHKEVFSSDTKIISASSAVIVSKAWRSIGHKVGFTNGCFDLLHPGHISTINKAKAACDKLIVGLNSDVSVSNIKGKNRPIQSEVARAQVLASLANVDAVIIFSEDTPAKIIKALKPEVFVKGADYNIDNIAEATIVRGYGGKIILAELEKGYSTTATLKQLDDRKL